MGRIWIVCPTCGSSMPEDYMYSHECTGGKHKCPSCVEKGARIKELEGADLMVRCIEGMFPNWRNFRDLKECIGFELDELARAGQDKDCLIIDNERLRDRITALERIKEAAKQGYYICPEWRSDNECGHEMCKALRREEEVG